VWGGFGSNLACKIVNIRLHTVFGERHLVSGPVRIPSTIRFGEDFELDPQTYKLRRAGRVLKLERIPMEILLFLVEERGKIVSREQIAERVWGKDVFLDTDNSTNGAIRKIRQVLRDDPEQPHFIQTITGQGYRFIAPVAEGDRIATHVLEPASSQTPTRTEEAPGSKTLIDPEPQPNPQQKTWLVYVALATALTVFLGGWVLSRAPRSFNGRVTLAVLPFQNLTGDASEDYFTDGLTEEMITQLGNLDPHHLAVIARTSVMHYKGTQASLDQIGRELAVEYVIEGSVRRDGKNVRVTAQLIQTKDQTHVWARQYDRELGGLLSLQGEIAQEVADEIQLTLKDHKSIAVHPAVPAQNYEAYDLYLKGQYFFNKRTAPDFREAIGYFQQAIAKDPNFARAYAALADSYALLGEYSTQSQPESISNARAAALHALQLDETLPEAHTALALIVQNHDWDWQTAEKEFRRAIELNPNYTTAHHWYAEHLMWRGRFDEALKESEQARQLDPLSLIVAADNGAILYFSRQYDRAIEKWKSVREMDPDFLRAHLIMGPYVEKGMFAEALANNEWFRPKISAASYWSWRAYIQGRAGHTEDARRALNELLKVNAAHTPVDPIVIAQAYAGLGEKAVALSWLEKAYAQRSDELVTFKVNPSYDSLRGEPRFQELLRRLRLQD
jgi:TolB-like protein/DNA-binding winged helix-turn-helix (wHTH) protein/Tfp pilus assembly protein PilF